MTFLGYDNSRRKYFTNMLIGIYLDKKD
jgi:hypothetical protein